MGVTLYMLSINVAEWSVTLVGLVISGAKKIDENIFMKSCLSRPTLDVE